ncbi:YrdB family protein [Kitasatospora sp. NPDC006697]|uniref:YrdB family protein n=1 Tax=Kitasatospora sp. NPDC006697 TaxID=3364020 RepID=UPI0036964D88
MGSRGIRVANEMLAFLLELVALGGLAWWGWAVGPGLVGRLLLAVAAPLLAAVLWGRYAAPRATVKLPLTGILVVKAVVFLSATAAFWTVAGAPTGLVFGLLCLVNTVLAYTVVGRGLGEHPDPRP